MRKSLDTGYSALTVTGVLYHMPVSPCHGGYRLRGAWPMPHLAGWGVADSPNRLTIVRGSRAVVYSVTLCMPQSLAS